MLKMAIIHRRTFIVGVALLVFVFQTATSDPCSKFSQPNELLKELYSPDYPNSYPNDMDCILRLSAPHHHTIRLVISDFALEPLGLIPYDYLEIRDGAEASSSLIGSFCGTVGPPIVFSSGRSLWLKFHSDHSNQYAGFIAKYQFVVGLNVEDSIQKEQELQKAKAVQEARDRVVRWLWGQRTPSWGWKGNTARALVALRLSGNLTGETQEEQLMAKQAELRVSVALASSPLLPFELSMHVHALLATCRDPRDFYGFDLVKRLKEKVASSANVTHPVAYLALCNAREAWPAKAVQDIEEILGSDSEFLFLSDIQSFAVLALSCQANSSKDFWTEHNSTALLSEYRSVVERFKRLQLGDGTFGSTHSTALITQALLSSGEIDKKDWNSTAAMNHLMRETNSSSLDFLSAYLMLPLFNLKTLADIRNVNCISSVTRKERRDIDAVLGDLSHYRGPKIRVRYSLFVGDLRDVTHTIALRVPQNFTAFQVMKVAEAEDPKYRFSWKTVSGRKHVHELARVSNDPEAGMFWLLYVSSENATEPYAHFSTGPDELSMHEGDHLVMWYRTFQL